MTDLTTMSAPQAQRELLRQRDAAIARAEAAEARVRALDLSVKHLQTANDDLSVLAKRSTEAEERAKRKVAALKAELATLREQLAAHEWRPFPGVNPLDDGEEIIVGVRCYRDCEFFAHECDYEIVGWRPLPPPPDEVQS